MTTKANTTIMPHRGSSAIDDVLDLGLVALSVAYLFLSDAFGFEISDEALIQIAAVGGASRATMRRVLDRLVAQTLAAEARAAKCAEARAGDAASSAAETLPGIVEREAPAPGVVERVIDPDRTPVDDPPGAT